MSERNDTTTTDASIYELYLVDDRLVADDEGNLIDTYDTLEEAEEAKRQKYRANDLHPGSYEVRGADRNGREATATVASQSELTFDTLLCASCAPHPLDPAKLEKVSKEEDEIAVYETFECPSCGEQYTVEQKQGSDHVHLHQGIITAQQADEKAREGHRGGHP